MIIYWSKSILFSLICFASFTLLLFSELFYIKTGFGPVSFFLFAAIPLALGLVLLLGKFSISRMAIASYIFIAILACYTTIGIFIYSRPTLAIQFVSSLTASFLFLNIGFYGSRPLLAKTLVLIIYVTFLFSLAQLSFFSFSYSGPYSIFENITNTTINSQNDFSIEVLYGRSAGIFNSPNSLGFFSGISFWLVILFRHDLPKIHYKLGSVASFLCLILSISRGSLIAFFASACVFFLLTFKRASGKTLINILSIGIALLIVATVVSNDFLSLIDQQIKRFSEVINVLQGDFGKSENTLGRFKAWGAIADRISEMPMGTILPPQLVINKSPDNQFIYYFAQGGLLLLAVVVSFIFTLIILAKKSKNKDLGIFFAILLFVVGNSMTITVMNSFIFMMFWMYLGLFARLDSPNYKLR